MKEFEFKPGDEVAHDGDVWIVESARSVVEVSKDISAKDAREEKTDTES